jgi:hypothetical protein
MRVLGQFFFPLPFGAGLAARVKGKGKIRDLNLWRPG